MAKKKTPELTKKKSERVDEKTISQIVAYAKVLDTQRETFEAIAKQMSDAKILEVTIDGATKADRAIELIDEFTDKMAVAIGAEIRKKEREKLS